MRKLEITSLDHVVFNVADPQRSIAFYAVVLGLQPERLEEYLAGTVPFPSVRVNAQTIIDFFPPHYHRVAPGGNNVNHVALALANAPHEIEAFLREAGVPVAREMEGNFGAQGDDAHAFQVLDPDGNTIELSAYVSRTSSELF
jgi:catechol 2,3-dioxygenase-like lactoylglutathione lyase family enzyme